MQPIMRHTLVNPLQLHGKSAIFRRFVTAPRSSKRLLPQPTWQIRWASGVSLTASSARSRIFNFFYGGTLLLGLGIVFIYVTDTRASVHRYVVVPVLRSIYRDPERAHEIGNSSLKMLWSLGLHPRERGDPDAKGDLEVEVFGTVLRNPIGTSAGIDKHASIPDPLMALGPAIIEIGGTTPLPQPGNEKPRVFRLSSQNALINRYGLNSEGADSVAARLRQRVREFAHARGFGSDESAEKAVLDGKANVPPGSLTPGKLLAINIAKNKATPESDIQAVANDYVYCVKQLGPYADIVVVNVSSPNTPGLRSLQQGESLKQILIAVVKAAKSTDRMNKPAVMVKVSPDEDSDSQIAGIAQAVWDAGVDGVIVGNTTNSRPPSIPSLRELSVVEQQHLLEQGGFSGPHLYEKTVALVKRYKKHLDNRPPSTAPQRKPGAVAAEAEKIQAKLAPTTNISTNAKISDDNANVSDHVTRSVETLVIPAKNISGTLDSQKEPLINLPSDRLYDQSDPSNPSITTSSPSVDNETSDKHFNSGNDAPKVIFATGGITNGKQALEILNAGASVAMVYTALVYGGAGTISRIKDEVRDEIKKNSDTLVKR